MEKGDILISVVIPLYNAERYIGDCLNSIVKQATQKIEVVVVDDGSTDGSPAIADKFAREYAFVNVIHQKNGGVIAARKSGIKHSRGVYIFSMDSDDWLGETHLADICREIERCYPDVVLTGYTDYYDGVENVFFQNIPEGVYGKEEINTRVIPRILSAGPFFTYGIYPTYWTSCVRRELLAEAVEQVPETFSLGEDIAVTYPCFLAAESISVTNLTGYYYRMVQTSITKSYNEKLAMENRRLFAYLNKVLPDDVNFQRQYCEYVTYMTCNLVYKYVMYAQGRTEFLKAINCIQEYLLDDTVQRALSQIRVFGRNVSLKWKVVIMLIRFRWFRLYRCLMRGKKRCKL